MTRSCDSDEAVVSDGQGVVGPASPLSSSGSASTFDAPVQVAVWSAEPGVFSHPGGPGGETFIVASGSGEIEIDGLGSHALEAGVIVVVPPDTASRLTVREPLRKLAVFHRA